MTNLHALITAARTRIASCEFQTPRSIERANAALDLIAFTMKQTLAGEIESRRIRDMHFAAFEVAATVDSDLSDYIRTTYLTGF